LFGKRAENGKASPPWKEPTEEHSFDELVRSLASGAISRRRALKLFGTTILGAALLPLLPDVAEADPRCPDSGPGCKAVCPGSRRSCVCVRTIEGKRLCVVPECAEPEIPCHSSLECGRGQVCALTARRCCEGGEPVCVQKCPKRALDAGRVQSASDGIWAKVSRQAPTTGSR
jgi:hypothetical protein